MSFLARRLAGKETAYFIQESKNAVTRLIEKSPKSDPPTTPIPNSPTTAADILPEVLRHSLPPKIYRQDPLSDSSSSITTASKWNIQTPKSNTHFSTISPDALNPLRAYLSLPQVTFGPKRWQLPSTESSVVASTANELRRDEYINHINPEKVRAAAEGLSHIGKAFAIASAIIFGSAALTFGFAASQLQLHNMDDIQMKGRDMLQPKFETIRELLSPLRDWAENTSSKWHLKNDQEIKERPIIKELSKMLGAKTSNSK